MLTYRQIPPNIFLIKNCPMKIKVGQAPSNCFVFKETSAYERGVRRSAHPQYEQG